MKSIGLKLWAGMMVLVVTVLIFLWLFQIVFLGSFYANMKVTQVKNEAGVLVQLIEQGSTDEFEKQAQTLTFNNNATLEILSSDGEQTYIVGTTGNNRQMPMMMLRERTQAVDDVLAGKQVTISMVHPRFGTKFTLIGVPIKKAGSLSGALVINMPMAPVEDTVKILKQQLLLITVILLLAAVLISYMISRSFIKPILAIKRVSDKIAFGDFSDRIEATSKDEIGQLAETINHMGQELAKTEQLRKDLIANVSHELRTPLSLIRGYAETIRDVSGNNPIKREQHLETIIDESERLDRIVNDILNLSQLQAGYAQLHLKSFVLGRTINNVSRRFDILAEKTGIPLIINGIGGVTVLADEPRIEQVLYNLINNAYNHTDQGGQIIINITEGMEAVKVEVSDTGAGIPQEDINQVWERFHQSDKLAARKVAGTGLGLAIVKEVLEAHKAPYGVKSKVGEGTTFWFELQKANPD